MTTWYARNDVPYSGGEGFLSITFPYIKKEHLHVFVNDVEVVDYVYLNDTQIVVNETLQAGDILSVRRNTPLDEKMVEFSDTSILNKDTQNLAQDQVFNVVQEMYDTLITNKDDTDNQIATNKADTDAQIEANRQELLAAQIDYENEIDTKFKEYQTEVNIKVQTVADAAEKINTFDDAIASANQAAVIATTKADEVEATAIAVNEALEDFTEQTEKTLASSLNKSQITNCIHEVPQRVNLTLSDGTLTLKKGSVVTVPYGTTDRTSEFPVGSQFLNSNWKVVDTQFADNKFFVWAELQKDISRNRTDIDGKDRYISVYLDGTLNGATGSQSGTTFSNALGYNTSENIVHWYDSSGVPQGIQLAFPIGIVACSDTYTFGSIKQVFNGMGYIGRTLWLDKDVKVLIGTGRNADGTIKNTEITTKLLIKTSHTYTEDRLLLYKKSGALEDIAPRRYLTGLKKDMPTTVSGTALYNYFCTDTLETYWSNGSTTTNWQQAENKTPIAVYGAIKEADGKTITFLNPYQAFRAVDYNEYKPAIDSKVSKTGDTMTGRLVVNTTDGTPIVIKGMGGVDVTVNPSSTKYYGIQLEDVNGVRMGRLESVFNANGTIETSITANKTVNGTVKYANFRVGVDANGNATYSHPQIISSYQNGTSWYIVYSNNFCIQGISEVVGNTTITLLKPYKDLNYTLIATPNASAGTVTGCYCSKVSTSQVLYHPSYRTGGDQGQSAVVGSIVAYGFIE